MRPKPGMSLTISFQKLRNQIKQRKFNYRYNYLHIYQGSPKPPFIIQNNQMLNSQQSVREICSALTGKNVITVYKQLLIAETKFHDQDKDININSCENRALVMR
ncbi:Hypothetical_protein [Hexamita inflata]|uniref:Hypothetical_protein n=1 Tax=Hexamita inflata TaxID=28002 RepID=A0AA86T9R8_9EUKA|nr:Hypothetical protein HINF_LOCUS1 [Hexamita inflata]CAI9919407.1 Hypothetical protein HINF_LOCUS7052 [Hexamita inflata]